MLAGVIELGPSDNIALDQPRVAMELIKNGESVGPGIFNTFLLDTGANSVLAMATAVGDMEGPPIAYETQGKFEEKGVAGDHPMDISIAYRFDFAGTSGVRNTLPDTRILSDPNNDFSIFGPWGIVGMPAMVNRVTSLDMTGWSGGGTGLEDLYMKTAFSGSVPADTEGHRYAIQVDNTPSFDPQDGLVSGDLPVWADVPFLTAVPTHHGVGQEGNFLFDTGAQISVISERLAIGIGLDSNDDGKLDENDDSFVTRQEVGGVGGTVNAPVLAIDEVHVPVKQVSTGDDVELVWTHLQWLVLDIDTGEGQASLDGVFGSDLITSGWFHAFFFPGELDGYIDQVHLDFQDMDNGSGTVYLDLNASVDKVIVPGPGIRLKQTARSTDVAEGGVTDTYSVVLTGEPTANVTVALGNTDGQVTAVNDADQRNQLVFTSTDWSTPQVVRVAAVDDTVAEGPHTDVITHTVTSGDGDYHNMTVPDITVNVTDDDLHLITITEDQAGQSVITSLDVAEGGTATYWVALNSQPPSGSIIYVQLQDPTSQVDPTHSDGLLTDTVEFTDTNWNVPQAVEVTGVDDASPEGPHQTQIVHTVYDFTDIFNVVTLGRSNFPVNISDNDLGGVVITETDGGTDIAEAGGTDTYQIALATVPTGEVKITVSADSQTQVSIDGTNFSPSRDLTFNSTDAQTITVRALDDDVAEAGHAGNITHAVTVPVNDQMYPTTLSIGDVSAAITDNDSAGLKITVDQQGQNPITSVNVAEGGTEVTYWVALTSEPKAEVTIFLGNSDGQVSVVDDDPDNELKFTTGNWSTPQQVHVNAVDDEVVEGAHSDRIIHGAVSGDTNYRGNVLLAANVADNDSPPTVAIARTGSSPTNANTVVFDITFSRDVQNVNFTDFTLDRSGVTTAALTAGDVTDAGDGDAATYQVTVSNVAGNGTLGLDIASDTDIADLASNALNQTPTPDETYTIDNTAPTIQSITSTTTDGSYNAGDTINVTVTFSESVTLSGGTLGVTLDTTDVVSILAFSNSATASGTYTVGAGDTSGDLDSTAIALDGGTLRDGAGNDATISLPATTIADGSDIVIDTGAPTIQSITSTTGDGAYNAGDAIDVTVTFSEDVTLSGGTLDVTLDTTDVVSIVAFSNSSTASGTYTVGSGDTSVDLDSTAIALNGGTLRDGAGNDATISLPGTTIADGSDIAIDTAAPTPTITGPSSPTGSDPFNVTIDFGETVAEFVQADVTVGNGSVTNLTDNGNGNFTATIDVTADAQVTVDVAANVAQDQAGNANAAATQFSVTYAADLDHDGVSNDTEDGAPNQGDGNKDETPDSQQNHVASLPNAVDGSYVTLAAPSGTTLVGVTATGNPSPNDAPEGVDFPIGFFDYTVSGVAVGGSVVVTLYPGSGVVVNTYCVYGPTPGDPTDHWYPFMFDGQTGAKIFANRIELHYVDGGRGDRDLTANGIIVDPGAPGGSEFLWQNPVLREDVNGDTLVTPLDVLILIADINSGRPQLPRTLEGSDVLPPYPDVDPNYEVTPLDVLVVIAYLNAKASGSGGEGESVALNPREDPLGLQIGDLGQSNEIAGPLRTLLPVVQSASARAVATATDGEPDLPRPNPSEAGRRSSGRAFGLHDAFRRSDVNRPPPTNASDQDLTSLDDNSFDSILEAIVPDVHRKWGAG